MNDTISRQAAIELCDWYEHEFCECDYAIRSLADDLKSLPAAERKRGEWIKQSDPNSKLFGWYTCSECGAFIGEEPPYCSECGADMRGEEE